MITLCELIFFVWIRAPPGPKRTEQLFPYTTFFRSTGDDVEGFRSYLGPGLGVWGRHEAKSWAADAGGQPPDRITRCPAAPSARDIPRVPNAIRLAREDRKSTRLNSSH